MAVSPPFPHFTGGSPGGSRSTMQAFDIQMSQTDSSRIRRSSSLNSDGGHESLLSKQRGRSSHHPSTTRTMTSVRTMESIREDHVEVVNTVFVPTNPSLGWTDMLSAIANCTNTILGAGTMAEPVAASHAGIIFYELVIIFMLFSSYVSVRWLIAVADTLPEGQPRNYEGIARIYLSPRAAMLISMVFVFGGFSLGMGYMLLIASSLKDIFVKFFFDAWRVLGMEIPARVIVLWGIGLGIVLPLALLRDISRLKITSSLAIITLAYAAIFVVVSGVSELSTSGLAPDYVFFNWSTRVFMCMGMMVSDFSCHLSAMPVYMALGPERYQGFMRVVVIVSLCISAVIYQLVGIISYLRFGDEKLSAGNVLATIAEAECSAADTECSVPMIIANVGISVTLIFSMPIAMWPLRSVVLTGFRSWQARELDSESAEELLCAEPSAMEWTGATCGLITAVLTLATLVPDIKVIMAVGGSVGGTFVVFIFPAAYYLSVVRKVNSKQQLLRAENAPQLIMIGFGCLFGVLCLGSSIKGALNKFHPVTATTTTAPNVM